jgi:hypothetical protein
MTIPKHLKDYVRMYPNAINQELCNMAVESLSKSKWQTHNYYRVKTNSHKHYDDDLAVTYDYIPEGPIITKHLWSVLETYILKDFASFNEWFPGWNGYTALRFNKYTTGTRMRLHCDHIHEMFDGTIKGIPTLSIIGALNDDYTGGEFVMWDDTVIDIPIGGVLIFPSTFMYPHEVKPVRSGSKYTYVSWVH